ncbi:hypothetical protein RDI58_022296 [Solanum bulbocastanum]|uniref:Uncharacterized protein n=1 Tax=Solanum bulbocastanum TaxID=147425 RepID=A0AAN8T785_SOLBU
MNMVTECRWIKKGQ